MRSHIGMMAIRCQAQVAFGGAFYSWAARALIVLLVTVALCARDGDAQVQCAAGTGLTASSYSNGTCVPCMASYFCASGSFNSFGARDGQTNVATLTGSSEGSPFRDPMNIAIAPDGSFALVTDCQGSNRVYRISIASGEASVLAGSGSAVTTDGVGVLASFNAPYGVAISPTGLFALVSENFCVRRIEINTGNVTTLAGSGAGGSSSQDGAATVARFNTLRCIAISPNGVFALVLESTSSPSVRRIDIGTGSTSTLTLQYGPGSQPSIFSPTGIAFSPDGAFVIFTDTGNHNVWSIVIATGLATRIAGGYIYGSLEDGVGLAAGFWRPSGVAISSDGAFALIADNYNNRVRRIAVSTYNVTTLAGSSSSACGIGMSSGCFTDGTGALAFFKSPSGVAISPDNSFALVADTHNFRVRRVALTAPCETGFFCPAGSSVATQNQCTGGYYCPAGSSIGSPAQCNITGYYCPAASSSASQNPCDAGFFCNISGLSSLSAQLPCQAGFYCPAASTSATQVACNVPGHFCPPASSTPTQAQCSAGFYCSNTGLSSSASQLPCNAGYYCPAGSFSATQFACDAGYYCDTAGRSSKALQVQCRAGYACPAGSSSPTQVLCSPGYFCIAGSSTPTAAQCSAGYYCPAGSPSDKQVPCTAGYYCSAQGLSSSDTQKQCDSPNYCPSGSSQQTPCPAGSYCSSPGLAAPTGTCSGFSCPAGQYAVCPQGTSQPCAPCPGGFICTPGNNNNQVPCTQGNYCPVGALAPIVCPIGSYCPTTALSAPISCTGGSFCSGTGLTKVSGPCGVGFVCTNGSSAPQTCPVGSICDRGSMSAATPCPAGRYCTSAGLTSLAGAGTCAPGSYSASGQQTCSPCPSGLISSTNGSAVCSLCPMGMYSSAASGASACQACAAGQACLLGSMPAPVAVTQPAASTPQSFNPFTATNAVNKDSLTSSGIMISAVIFPIVALIIVLAIVAERKPAVQRTLQTFGGRLSVDWSQLDLFFSEIHFAYLYLGKTTPIRKTPFGAAMSMACIGSILAVALILGVNNVRYPIYSSTIDPQSPPWQPVGEYKLSVRVLGGGVEQCANFAITYKNYDWSVPPETPPNVYNAAEGSCSLLWQCSGNCAMMATSVATLQLKSAPRAWASYFYFSLNTPLPSSSTAPLADFGSLPFRVASGAFPQQLAGMQNFTALRGATATNVSITLTPFIVNGTNGQTQAVAFEPSLAGVEYGDAFSRGSFDFNSNADFIINFDLKRSPLAVVNAASTTAVVNFLVLLSSTVGTIIGAFQLAVKQIESFLEFKPSDGLDDAGSGSGGGDADKGASNKEPIELTAVSFSSKPSPSADEHKPSFDAAAVESRLMAIIQQQQHQQNTSIQTILAKLQQIEQHVQLSSSTTQAAAVPAPHHHTVSTSGDGYGQMQDD